jgi:hypothetical protein
MLGGSGTMPGHWEAERHDSGHQDAERRKAGTGSAVHGGGADRRGGRVADADGTAGAAPDRADECSVQMGLLVRCRTGAGGVGGAQGTEEGTRGHTEYAGASPRARGEASGVAGGDRGAFGVAAGGSGVAAAFRGPRQGPGATVGAGGYGIGIRDRRRRRRGAHRVVAPRGTIERGG